MDTQLARITLSAFVQKATVVYKVLLLASTNAFVICFVLGLALGRCDPAGGCENVITPDWVKVGLDITGWTQNTLMAIGALFWINRWAVQHLFDREPTI